MNQPPNSNLQSPSPLRIALWCAVSSKRQAAENKTSLQDQENAGHDFADAIGGHVVRIYTVTHTRDLIFWPDDIPAYTQLRQDCTARAFDVLHAIDIDRLGRDPALSNQVISLVEKSGAEVYLASAPHPIGQTSTGQRYVHAIQTVRAKEAQDRRVQGQRNGMQARVLRGLPACHWPIGYTPTRDPDTGQVIGAQLDDLAPAVQLITKLFLQGESYYSIRNHLNQSPYHPPRSSKWTYSSIHSVMQNTIYAGYPTWGDVRPDQPSDKYPLLWNAATYTAIKRELARRAPDRGQRSTGSPVSAICYCARCGARMHRTSSTGRQPRLRCGTQSGTHIHGRTCHANSIIEATVIQAIADHLANLAANPTALDHATHTDDTAHIRAQLDDLAQRIAAVDTKRQRLAHAFAAGKMDLDLYHTTDTQLKADAVKLQNQQSQLHELLSVIPDPAECRAAIFALAPIFSELVSTVAPQQIRAALQNTGLRVELEAGTITAIYPSA